MPHYFVTIGVETADALVPLDRLVRIIRDTILPSVESLADLQTQGKVVTAGYPVGGRFMVFIVEANSEEDVHELLTRLPLSGKARTTVRRFRSIEELRDFDGQTP